MTDTPASPLWQRILRAGLAIAACLFVVQAGLDLARKWDSTAVHVNLMWVLLAVPLACVATGAQGLAWLTLMAHWTGRRLPLRPALALFYAAQLARYTPGKVGLPAVRVAGAAKLGVGKAVMGSTLLVETLVWGALGAAVGSFFLAFLPDRVFALGQGVAHLAELGLVLAVLGLVVLVGLDRSLLPSFAQKLLGLHGSGKVVPLRTVVLIALHWLAWVLHGAVLGLALGAHTFLDALSVGASLVLAIVVGFAALLAPAGAGVREALIGVGAAPVLGPSGALAAALLARGISLIVELGFWLGFRTLSGSRPAAVEPPHDV